MITPSFDHSFSEAQAFLDALAGKPNAVFTFQTFLDRDKSEPPTPKGDPRTRILTGTFEQHKRQLIELNKQRAGVFVAVNPQKNAWRSDANTAYPRAIWHENDGAIKDNVTPLWPIEPNMVVRTRENRTHLYWLLNDTTESDWGTWHGIEHHMVQHRQSDPNCTKRCQVLRIPGFWHQKDPLDPHLVTLERPFRGRRYSINEMAHAFPPVEVPQSITAHITEHQGNSGDILDLPTVSETKWADVLAMLDHINPDASAVPTQDGGDGTRGRWLRVLMALEETKHPDRRIVADEWSRCGGLRDARFPAGTITQHRGYNEGEVEYQMASFRRASGNKVGLGSLVRYAREGGYVQIDMDDLIGSSSKAEPQRQLFIVTQGDEALSKEIPRQDFLLDRFISGANTFSAIAGRGGVGKSKLALGIACSVATGTAAFGYGPLVPHYVGSTVLVDLENEPHEFSRRLQDHARAMVEHGLIDKADIAEVLRNVQHVFVDRMLFALAVNSMGSPIRQVQHWQALHDELCRIRDRCIDGPRWICFDALYKFHALSENDPAQMTFALEQLNDLTNRVFGPIPRSVVHHSAKGDTATDYFTSQGGKLRGSGAIEAAMRSVVQVRHLSPDELKLFSISKAQQREFAICGVMKSNYQVMQPDSFMLRSYAGAWWHCGRDVTTVPKASNDAGFNTFLARLYELIVVKGVRVTHRTASEGMRGFLGAKKSEIGEWLAQAELGGYLTKQGLMYKWAGIPPDESGSDLGL